MPDMQQSCAEVDVGLCEPKKLSGSQAGLGEMVKLGAELAIDEAKPRK